MHKTRLLEVSIGMALFAWAVTFTLESKRPAEPAVPINFAFSSKDFEKGSDRKQVSHSGLYTIQFVVGPVKNDIWIPLESARVAPRDPASYSTAGVNYQIKDLWGQAVREGEASSRLLVQDGGTPDSMFVKINKGEKARLVLEVTFEPKESGNYGLQALTVGWSGKRVLPEFHQELEPSKSFFSGWLKF